MIWGGDREGSQGRKEWINGLSNPFPAAQDYSFLLPPNRPVT